MGDVIFSNRRECKIYLSDIIDDPLHVIDLIEDSYRKGWIQKTNADQLADEANELLNEWTDGKVKNNDMEKLRNMVHAAKKAIYWQKIEIEKQQKMCNAKIQP
jgi:hypothetical protein